MKTTSWNLSRDDFIRLSYFNGDLEQGSEGKYPINGSGNLPYDVVYMNERDGCLTREAVSSFLDKHDSFIYGYKMCYENNVLKGEK